MNEDDFHTASHLYINASIKFNDFLCQKFLHEVFTRKGHLDLSFIPKLSVFLGQNYKRYSQSFEFLMREKTTADYDVRLSESVAKQIKRKATFVKETAEKRYP